MRAPVVNDRASRDHKLLAWVPGRAGLVARAVHSLVVCYRHGLGWTVLRGAPAASAPPIRVTIARALDKR